MDQDLRLPLGMLAAHAGTDLAVGLSVLMFGLRNGRPALAPATVERVVAAFFATAVAALAGTWMGIAWFGVDPLFGSIHLLFIDVLVVAPVLGLAILATTFERAGREADWRRAVRVLAGGALVGAGTCAAWGHWIEPFLINLERPTIVAGGLSAPLRIGILADLQTSHVTEHEHRAVDRLLAAEPDLILIPGDVFQGSRADFEREREALRGLLRKLEAPFGVFAVIGNSDRPDRFRETFEGLDVIWLHNQIHTVTTPLGTIVIGGVTYTDSAIVGEIQDRVGRRRADHRLTIVLTHDPGVNWRYRGLEHQPDLIVAGHTHGGQVRLPLLGAPITLSRYPRRLASGSHQEGETVYYVSRGVGVERKQAPRIRFMCPPEITLLSVTPRPFPGAAATSTIDSTLTPLAGGSHAGGREAL